MKTSFAAEYADYQRAVDKYDLPPAFGKTLRSAYIAGAVAALKLVAHADQISTLAVIDEVKAIHEASK